MATEAILKRRMMTEMMTQAIPASRYAPMVGQALGQLHRPDSTLELSDAHRPLWLPEDHRRQESRPPVVFRRQYPSAGRSHRDSDRRFDRSKSGMRPRGVARPDAGGQPGIWLLAGLILRRSAPCCPVAMTEHQVSRAAGQDRQPVGDQPVRQGSHEG